MNPHGVVVNENTNGIITVNGHSFEAEDKKTSNTNFALLVSKHFSEPFKDSNGYGESIARLSNMLGGGKVNLIGNIIEQEFTVNSNWYLGSGLSLVMMVFIIISMVLLEKFDKTGEGTFI